MKKPKMYVVFYLSGNEDNFVCKKLNGVFPEIKAEVEVATLNRMGHPAMLSKESKAAIIGGFCSLDEFKDEKSRKAYYQEVVSIYMKYPKMQNGTN